MLSVNRRLALLLSINTVLIFALLLFLPHAEAADKTLTTDYTQTGVDIWDNCWTDGWHWDTDGYDLTTADFMVNGSFDGADSDVFHSTLTIESTGIYNATSETTTITENVADFYSNEGTLTHNDGTFRFDGPMIKIFKPGTTTDTKYRFYDLIIDANSQWSMQVAGSHHLYCEGDLTIVEGELTQAHANTLTLTVEGTTTIENGGVLDWYVTDQTDAVSFLTLIILSGGTYDATAGTTTIATHIQYTGSTFTHNEGTVSLSGSGDCGGNILGPYYNLEVSQDNKEMRAPWTVINRLNVNSGYIRPTVANNILTLGNSTQSGTFYGAVSKPMRVYDNPLATGKYFTIQAASESYPGLLTGNEWDWAQVGNTPQGIKFKWLDVQFDISADGDGNEFKLIGDCEFDAFNLQSGDTLDLNGCEATVAGTLTTTGTFTSGGTSAIALGGSATWIMNQDATLRALFNNGTVAIDPGRTLTFSSTTGFGASSGILDSNGNSTSGVTITGSSDWDFDTSLKITADYSTFSNYTHFQTTKEYADGCRFDHCTFNAEVRVPAGKFIELTYCTLDPSAAVAGAAGGLVSKNHNATDGYYIVSSDLEYSAIVNTPTTNIDMIYGDFEFDETVSLTTVNGSSGSTLTFSAAADFTAETLNCSFIENKAVAFSITGSLIFHDIANAGFSNTSTGVFDFTGTSSDFVVLRSVVPTPSNKWHIYSDAIGSYDFLFVNVSNGVCDNDTGIVAKGIDWTGNSGTWDFQSPFWVINYPGPGDIIKNLETFAINATAYDTDGNLFEVLVVVIDQWNNTLLTENFTINGSSSYDYGKLLDSSQWETGFYTFYFLAADNHNKQTGKNRVENGRIIINDITGEELVTESQKHHNPYMNLTLSMGKGKAKGRLSYRNTTEATLYNITESIEVSDEEGNNLSAVFMDAFDQPQSVRTEIQQVDGHYKITWYVDNIKGTQVKIFLEGENIRYIENSTKAGHFLFGSLASNLYYFDFQDVIDSGHRIIAIDSAVGGYYVTISNESWKAGDDITIDPEIGGVNTHEDVVTVLFVRTYNTPYDRDETPTLEVEDNTPALLVAVMAVVAMVVVAAVHSIRQRG